MLGAFMFDRILSLFSGNGGFHTELPAADARTALGALMVRASKVDKAYLFEEVEQIDKVLSKLYNLNPVQAAKMRAVRRRNVRYQKSCGYFARCHQRQ
jgi:uncharacterized tellurite resistance protein B-like protein